MRNNSIQELGRILKKETALNRAIQENLKP